MDVVQDSQFRQLAHSSTSWGVDELFYNSMLGLRCKMIWQNIYSLIKLTLLLVFVSWFYSQNPKDHYFGAFIAQIIVTAVYTTVHLIFSSAIYNLEEIIKVADATNHLIVYEEAAQRERRDLSDFILDNVYSLNEEVRDGPELSDQEKRKLEAMLQDVIEQCFALQHKCLLLIDYLAEFTRFILMIVFLVKVCKDSQLQGPLKLALILLIVTEFIAKIKLILHIIAAILSPLILLFVCLIMMWCYPEPAINIERTDFDLDDRAIEYKPSIRLEEDHECGICFQNFRQKDQIVILPCHSKHAFHLFCIKTWFNMSRTCPMCRTHIA